MDWQGAQGRARRKIRRTSGGTFLVSLIFFLLLVVWGGGSRGRKEYGTLRNPMEFLGTPWNSLDPPGTQKNSLELRRTSGIIISKFDTKSRFEAKRITPGIYPKAT
jgi:hypothetical protein